MNLSKSEVRTIFGTQTVLRSTQVDGDQARRQHSDSVTNGDGVRMKQHTSHESFTKGPTTPIILAPRTYRRSLKWQRGPLVLENLSQNVPLRGLRHPLRPSQCPSRDGSSAFEHLNRERCGSSTVR